ncbi:MAG: porin family protein [Cytophagales bacterium]|nr:porin family protein [Cytophagales bacterium]
MQTPYPRHKFDIRWLKISLVALVLLASFPSWGQSSSGRTENLIHYDDEFIHYGFAFGGHASRYVFKYNDTFVSPSFDSLHSIANRALGGFKVGFVVNFHLLQYLDLRVLPTFGLYENELQYRFTNGTTFALFKDATYFELPIVLKYKSVRRRNHALYVVGGVSPSLEAAARGDEVADVETLETRNWNFAIETGIGFDIYFPLFKFSPEIRYSWGLRNLLSDNKNDFNAALDKLVQHNFTFFITFEGGPSYLKKRRLRR